MVKLLVLQQLYNLSDDALEYQVLDRRSFLRFLDLEHSPRVPDAKTIWVWRLPRWNSVCRGSFLLSGRNEVSYIA